ncbi:hypothetical protein Anas_02338 [Armadillidium nasatum]|uniref:Single domain-containing protein n=1 Tax=Armadillidium nasatum TaxID=96803 RepID=A0A5N5SUB2_9CRUS|nr:hypothetical protein Anas_02338 [Armadillidium nasatum]
MKLNIHLMFLLLVTIIGVCNAAVAFEILYPDPDHPNSCVTLDSKRKSLIIPVGEKRPAPLGSCYELECNKAEGGNFNLVKTTCGKAVINGKVVEENKSVLYPQCCQG